MIRKTQEVMKEVVNSCDVSSIPKEPGSEAVRTECSQEIARSSRPTLEDCHRVIGHQNSKELYAQANEK